MEVRLADSAYREADSLEQHLYLYIGPSSLNWLITAQGETRYLGSKPWKGFGNVEAVHQLTHEEESLGFPYASIQVVFGTNRLHLIPQDIYRPGEGLDYFEIADQLKIDEELQRSKLSQQSYEMVFPINRGYLLAWQIAFPAAKIKLLHELVVENAVNGCTIWLEDDRLLFCVVQEGVIQAMQVKPVENEQDFQYQLGLIRQAFPSIDSDTIPIYLGGSKSTTGINWRQWKSGALSTIESNLRISPTHLHHFQSGEFQVLFQMACV